MKNVSFICVFAIFVVPLHQLSDELLKFLLASAFRRRDVAQPGSATVWGTGGRKFKSCHPDEKNNHFISEVVILCIYKMNPLAITLLEAPIPSDTHLLGGIY